MDFFSIELDSLFNGIYCCRISVKYKITNKGELAEEKSARADAEVGPDLGRR
jgi:hypothetical protein